MRFIMNSGGERTHATQTPDSSPRMPRTRSTPQTRRRNDLPDTTTIKTTRLDDMTALHNKILDPDPNRELHYRAPTLKGRILR